MRYVRNLEFKALHEKKKRLHHQIQTSHGTPVWDLPSNVYERKLAYKKVNSSLHSQTALPEGKKRNKTVSVYLENHHSLVYTGFT